MKREVVNNHIKEAKDKSFYNHRFILDEIKKP